MKVRHMLTSSGRPSENQFILHDVPAGVTLDGVAYEAGSVFQSYDSLICHRTHKGEVYLDKYLWDKSITTGKYRNYFLGEKINETRKKIESGEYKLVELANR